MFQSYNRRLSSKELSAEKSQRDLARLNTDVFWNHTWYVVLNGELYAQRFQKLIYLHLFTDCFMKSSPYELNRRNIVGTDVFVPTIEDKFS